jgi:hypothetical protein
LRKPELRLRDECRGVVLCAIVSFHVGVLCIFRIEPVCIAVVHRMLVVLLVFWVVVPTLEVLCNALEQGRQVLPKVGYTLAREYAECSPLT